MRILSCRFVMWRYSFVTLSQSCKNPLSWIIPLTSFQISFAILHSFVRTSYEFEASPHHSSDNPPLEFCFTLRFCSYRFAVRKTFIHKLRVSSCLRFTSHYAKSAVLNYRVCTSSNFISDCFRNLAFSSYVHLTSLRLRLITLPIIRKKKAPNGAVL